MKRNRRGATAVEYVMILIFVVIPLALMFPLFIKMVGTYGDRMTAPVGLPFP